MVNKEKTSKYPFKSGAIALRAARKTAGFRSAASAALHFGFSESTYRAQESGRRRIQPEDAAKYAAAFDIKSDELLAPHWSSYQRYQEKIRQIDYLKSKTSTAARRQTASRLRFARIARGFDSAKEACKTFSFGTSTYLSHEGGVNRLSDQVADLYCVAFEIRKEWLLNGTLPSGLGERIDARLETTPADRESGLSLRQLANPTPSIDMDLIDALKENLATSRSSGPTSDLKSDVIGEIPFADLRQAEGDVTVLSYRRSWALPLGFVSEVLHASKTDVIIAVADFGRTFGPGDRIFVDTSKTDLRQSGVYLVIHEGQVHQLESRKSARAGYHLPADVKAIGKIVGKLSLIRD